ncbi:acyl-CoA thioesterase [Stygiobacter electus]|uniref:Thioesterase family protein n=1 Tax=Stygiobacter electus TaxID=3032292 RepID=A0AAE3P1T3_9BACT|nr:thioesterase family protein [Stygiobacter electus]MDF1612754.1 thioesterase family protein [Stygiobacter electus]
MNKEQFKHKINIKVRFSDLDAMRHVNNATYLTYLEEARIEYFNKIFDRCRSDLNFQAVVGKIEISYLYPIELGDDVEVYTRVSKLGNKSADVEHLIAVKKGNKIINSAESITKLVFYDYKNKTTKLIPEEVKQIIKKFEGLEQ